MFDTINVYDVTAENEFIGTDENQISVGGKYNRQSEITLIDVEDVYYQNREDSISGVLYYGESETPYKITI